MTPSLAEWLPPLFAALTCWLVLTWLLKRNRGLPMDHPNDRSLHESPTPRIGGLGIMAGIASTTIWLSGAPLLPMMLAAFALTILSLLDDLRGLPVILRLLSHVAAALVCLSAWGVSGWPLLLGLFAAVWMTNLYNFMDGADGLAGGMAVLGFGALAGAAWYGQAPDLASFCAAVAASALVFLSFNFPPARLFMGDAGSIPLGFLAAMLGILGWQRELWSPLFPILVFSPFIVDATLTLIRRFLAGERIWQAHRSHYYQRLIRMGWGHRRTALAEYGLMAVMILIGLSLEWSKAPLPTLLLTVLLYALIVFLVDRRWRKHGIWQP